MIKFWSNIVIIYNSRLISFECTLKADYISFVRR